MEYRTKIYEVVITPDKFDTLSLGSYKGNWLVSEDTLKYSMLIHYHPETNTDFMKIRSRLEITEMMEYPTERLPENVVILPFSLYGDEVRYKLLEELIYAFLEKYKLHRDFFLPLQVKVLTGVMPIPADTGGIYVHTPIDKPKDYQGGKLSLRLLSDDPAAYRYQESQNEYYSNYIFPSITITRNISSKNDFHNWIDKFWASHIEAAVKPLPKYSYQRFDLDEFTLGMYLWFLKNSGMKWKEITKIMDELVDNKPDLFGDEDSVPTTRDMQKRLSDHTNAMKRFYPF